MERLADSLAGRSGSSNSDDIAGVAVSASYGSGVVVVLPWVEGK